MKMRAGELEARVTIVVPRHSSNEVIVEARLGSQPWSMRIRPWTPPDDTGTCMAFVSFLTDDAPWVKNTPIQLTIGAQEVGTCIIHGTAV
jgi:hypothetical protein